jgi:CDP-6-deoxy-D-xylo-4-hexulose-3-dehydrase
MKFKGSDIDLKNRILELTREYSKRKHSSNRPGNDEKKTAFIPGETTVPYAGRVFTEDEVEAAVSTTLDFWLTLGPEGHAFEKELADIMGVRYSLLVNSGSSANLIALSTLTSHKIKSPRRILPGDEVITCSAGFPTTVAPIIQNGCIPVFVDNNPITANIDINQLEQAYSPGKTKAVMIAHTLGNPFDIGAVLDFCHKFDLWLIEDNCDALGSMYSMPIAKAEKLSLQHLIKIAEKGEHKLIRFEHYEGEIFLTAPTGTWGDISTQSFYPPHHLTMGEGGAVNITWQAKLKIFAESFRDWGRDCWCPSGQDNTCNKRFCWQLGELPKGYDHKYIYSHLGYNLKPLDPQAAIGRVQLKRLPEFIQARKENWEYLRTGLDDLSKYFEFTLPTHAISWEKKKSFIWDKSGNRTSSSWFGFMISVKKDAPFSNSQLGNFLDDMKIGNRMLFGGNLLKQPVFVELKKDRPDAFRVIGENVGADTLMNQALFLGTYPGLTHEMMDYVIKVIHEFVQSKLK